MMMTVLDQATRRRAVQAFFALWLLTFSCDALASHSPISGNVKSRKYSPNIVKVHDRTERKLAAVPAPEPAVSGNAASAPSPQHPPRPPPPPPNLRSALLSPNDDTPGRDLPPRILSPLLASEAPIASPIVESKRSKVLLILGVTLAVLDLIIIVSLSAVAYWKPEWLPCLRPQISQSATVVPTM